MVKVSDETIGLILSPKFDENFWLFELGRAETIISDSPSLEHQFMDSFLEKGERLWNKHKELLKGYLCDKEKREPKAFVKNVTNEGLIEISHKIIDFLTNNHDIVMAFAIPLCGIVLKKGVNTLCR